MSHAAKARPDAPVLHVTAGHGDGQALRSCPTLSALAGNQIECMVNAAQIMHAAADALNKHVAELVAYFSTDRAAARTPEPPLHPDDVAVVVVTLLYPQTGHRRLQQTGMH
jgi:hypothetical protein